jgi:hypothetical protein
MNEERRVEWQHFLAAINEAYRGRQVHVEVNDAPLAEGGSRSLNGIALEVAHPPLRESRVVIRLGEAGGQAAVVHHVPDPVSINGYHDENQLDMLEIVARDGSRTLVYFDTSQ